MGKEGRGGGGGEGDGVLDETHKRRMEKVEEAFKTQCTVVSGEAPPQEAAFNATQSASNSLKAI